MQDPKDGSIRVSEVDLLTKIGMLVVELDALRARNAYLEEQLNQTNIENNGTDPQVQEPQEDSPPMQ